MHIGFDIHIELGWDRADGNAGLLTIYKDRPNRCAAWCLHFAVHPKAWDWGYTSEWFDGYWRSFGLGPVFLFCVSPD